VAFNCALWIVIAGARVGFQGELDAGALLVYLATVPLVLGVALVIALAYGAPERLLLVAVALSARRCFRLRALRYRGSSSSPGSG
jgi:hypothetical protein